MSADGRPIGGTPDRTRSVGSTLAAPALSAMRDWRQSPYTKPHKHTSRHLVASKSPKYGNPGTFFLLESSTGSKMASGGIFRS